MTTPTIHITSHQYKNAKKSLPEGFLKNGTVNTVSTAPMDVSLYRLVIIESRPSEVPNVVSTLTKILISVHK